MTQAQQEKFGIKEEKTLLEYVLWLETDEGKKFIEENARDIESVESHWTKMEMKANIIKDYVLEIIPS